MLKLKTHASMHELGEAAWTPLLGSDPEPYLRWPFLDALEQTGCVRPQVGWVPCHLGLYQGEQLVAAAPAYLKGNSEGEFVFDQGWAEFAEQRLNLSYYPKLVLSAPFTPATGRRILTLPGEDATLLQAALLGTLGRLCDDLQLSGAHVLFPEGGDLDPYLDAKMLHRHGVQFQWHNPGYRSFDDFLSRFTSKRRNRIKRERRQVQEQGLQVEAISGRDATPELIDHVYEFYRDTVQRHYYGRQYLNRAFFEEICARMPGQVVLMVARRSAQAPPVAGAFNLLGGGVMYGRYWGTREALDCLHFEVCFYRGIEFAIDNNLTRFEPGAGGEHKLARGFEPTVTHSFHRLSDTRLSRVVADFLQRERDAIAAYRAQEQGPLRLWSASSG